MVLLSGSTKTRRHEDMCSLSSGVLYLYLCNLNRDIHAGLSPARHLIKYFLSASANFCSKVLLSRASLPASLLYTHEAL